MRILPIPSDMSQKKQLRMTLHTLFLTGDQYANIMDSRSRGGNEYKK